MKKQVISFVVAVAILVCSISVGATEIAIDTVVVNMAQKNVAVNTKIDYSVSGMHSGQLVGISKSECSITISPNTGTVEESGITFSEPGVYEVTAVKNGIEGKDYIAVNNTTAIKVKGELLYLQDFEGTVEEKYTHQKKGVFEIAKDDTGNTALKLTTMGQYGLAVGPFGPTIENGIIEADIKQINTNSVTLSAINLGGRVTDTGSGVLSGYRFCYNDTTNMVGTSVRDVVSLAYTQGGDGAVSQYYYYPSASNAAGALQQTGGKRYFKDYYTLSGVMDGTNIKSNLEDKNGNIVSTLATTVDNVAKTTAGTAIATPNASGQISISTNTVNAYLDNVRAYNFNTITGISAIVDANIPIYKPANITITAGAMQLTLSAMEVSYDTDKLYIDRIKGTVTPLKFGSHMVTIKSKSVETGEYKSYILTFNTEENIRVDISSNNLAPNVHATIGVKRITENGIVSNTGNAVVTVSNGATYDSVNGTVSAAAEGVYTVNVTQGNMTDTAYFSVQDESVLMLEKGALVYSQDFNTDASIETAYSTPVTTDTIIPTKVTFPTVNFADGTSASSQAMQYDATPGKSVTLGGFGPTDMTNYVLEADVMTTASGANSNPNISFGMRAEKADSANPGREKAYRIAYNPSLKILANGTVGNGGNDDRKCNMFSIWRSNNSYTNNSYVGKFAYSSEIPLRGTTATVIDSGNFPGGSFKSADTGVTGTMQDMPYRWQGIMNGSDLYMNVKNITTGRTLVSLHSNTMDYNSLGGAITPRTSGITVIGMLGVKAMVDNINMYSISNITKLNAQVSGMVKKGSSNNLAISESVDGGTKILATSDVVISSATNLVSVRENTVTPKTSGRHYAVVSRTGIDGKVKQSVMMLDVDINFGFSVLTPTITFSDGTAISDIATGDVINAKTTIANNSIYNRSAIIILAIYDGNSLVQNVNHSTIVKAGETVDLVVPFTWTVSMPKTGTLKAFIWDSLDATTPLAEAEET